MHYFSNSFDKVLDMFRTGPLSIIRGISTLYTRDRYLSGQDGSILITLADRKDQLVAET